MTEMILIDSERGHRHLGNNQQAVAYQFNTPLRLEGDWSMAIQDYCIEVDGLLHKVHCHLEYQEEEEEEEEEEEGEWLPLDFVICDRQLHSFIKELNQKLVVISEDDPPHVILGKKKNTLSFNTGPNAVRNMNPALWKILGLNRTDFPADSGFTAQFQPNLPIELPFYITVDCVKPTTLIPNWQPSATLLTPALARASVVSHWQVVQYKRINCLKWFQMNKSILHGITVSLNYTDQSVMKSYPFLNRFTLSLLLRQTVKTL